MTDEINRVLRDHNRYTGDGLLPEVTGAPLPIGDPSSGVYHPTKADLRAALNGPAAAAEVSAAQAALYDGIWFDDLAGLISNTVLSYTSGVGKTRVEAGDYVLTRSGFSCAVAASGATDHQSVTAGGVKLYYKAGVFAGKNGKKFQLLSGVIRNTGSGWFFIDDAGHAPTGFTGIVNNADGTITLQHDVGASRVSSIVMSPDETYSGYGITCGPSVGLDSSTITFYAPIEGILNADTGAVSTPFWSTDISAAIAGGKITLTHPATLNRIGLNISQSGAAPRADLTVSTSHPTNTTTDITFAQEIEAYIAYSGSAWVVSAANNSGISAAFAANVLTITHDTAVRGNWNLKARHPYRESFSAYSATSIGYLFKTDAGAIVTAADTSMQVSFARNGVNPIVGATVKATLGQWEFRGPLAKIPASRIFNGTGNFWILGVGELDG